MRLLNWFVGLAFIIATTSKESPAQQQAQKAPERDAQSVEILTRVVQAAGGEQAVAAIHDITERGEVTFHFGKGVKGQVTLMFLGGNRYRMEADLPPGESLWVVRNGEGWKREEGEKVEAISTRDAVSMGNWTFPIGYVAAALADATTDVSFRGIETNESRAAYRIRVKGRLGLVSGKSPLGRISKDLLIDTNTFDVVSVSDYPFHTYERGKLSDTPPREISFNNFRSVNGVRFPFSMNVKVLGQQAMQVNLSQITPNSGVPEDEFQPLK
jgi:outer membrane lipoprotein-sorting protein